MLKKKRLEQLVLLLGDFLMIMVACDYAGFTRFGNFHETWALYKFPMVVMGCIYIVSFYVFTLYEHAERFRSTYFLSRFLAAVGFGFLISAILNFYIFSLRLSRLISVFGTSYTIIFVTLWRFIYDHFSKANIVPERVLIVGAGRLGQDICSVVKHRHNLKIVGFLDDDQDKQYSIIEGIKVAGSTDLLPLMAKKKKIDTVIVAISYMINKNLFHNLLAAKLSGVQVINASTFYEEITGRIPMAHIQVRWIVFTSIKGMSRYLYKRFKRYLDIFLSLSGLIIASPIMAATAVLIKMDSKGPIIYRQQRMGKNGKEFTMYKFRSMVRNAEQKEGGLYTSVTDSRVTKVGRIIRRLRIDELPQLWNVLFGNMSFVGPRPEAVELSQQYERYIPYYLLRHSINPGLTGWAQVKFSYGASLEDAIQKFEYDMFYIKNMSILMDIQIVLKTISVVLFAHLRTQNESRRVEKDRDAIIEDPVVMAMKILKQKNFPAPNIKF